ncbi:MAG TPA: TM0106 family RecB-like putative nuclease [Mycobacteriales bacterium]|nr:TM0106 family RecB-like putative nuclease [Mycobacteriales bacterium]
MFIADGLLVCSPSDLTAAVECEFGWLRRLDEKLGRVEPTKTPDDAMLQRTAFLGDAYEARVLAELTDRYGAYDAKAGTGVFTLERPTGDIEAMSAVAEQTLRVLRGGADVVYQGAFYRPGFLGYADFLIRDTSAGTRWAVYDTKLARHAKVSALLQIAAYADELGRLDIPVADEAHLLLGDGTRSSHRVADLVPVYRERRARLDAIAAEHEAEASAVAWGDPRYGACGRCETCATEVEAHRDLLLVANLRMSQRAKLIAAGIGTIDALAATTDPVTGLSTTTLATLAAQARLQVQQSPPDAGPDQRNEMSYDVFNPVALAVLPEPDPGDIFFDFEGDPLWTDADVSQSGLEYLFGVVEAPVGTGAAPVFRAFWAHDRAQERQALIDFLAYVAARRAKYPNMRIYHYASYEKTALLRLAGRYGVGEDEVDDLLRENVLVDLYAVVRNAVRVSQPSYSIKKLEPLYMGDQFRRGDVTTAGDSIVAYAHYCELRDAGKRQEADDALAAIADYNEYDCVSTLRLRDWLLERAAEHRVDLAQTVTSEEDGSAGKLIDADPELTRKLTADFADLPRAERTPEQQARALLAASLGYHQREDKPVWWAHFDRLQHPVEDWADTAGVMLVDEVELLDDWAITGKQKKPHRTSRVSGTVGGGIDVPAEVFVLYDPTDMPTGVEAPPGYRGTTKATVVGRAGDDPDTVVIDEISATAEAGGAARPVALAPCSVVPTSTLRTAITEVAMAVAAGGTQSAIFDLLARRPPRLRTGGPVPPSAGPPDAELLAGVVANLDGSYLAVQGPPGSGKTYTGGRVVKLLVESGWKVGIVAQSHRVVENFLDCVAQAGLPAVQIGKKAEAPNPGWTGLKGSKIASWIADHGAGGCVLGGTAWDFVNTNGVSRGELDLLVVDEAGQFSLANTIAVSVAAKRLLLLGDPQQLPQVSQGTHPEPCDESALSWIMDGHYVMPSDRGYFLSRSWRMHPDLCAAVSRLSYDGKLASQAEVTSARHLAGFSAGVEVVQIDHQDNATSSVEEAAAVAGQVGRFLGQQWTAPDEDSGPRPLAERDILVVAPYNAQVSAVRRALDGAGFKEVRVGTVDKFQGQEAPVVIVSMTASAPSEVPRGMGFLLNRNRVNVAVSRAKWRTVIVRSPSLTDYLPNNPAALAELGAFIGLCGC